MVDIMVLNRLGGTATRGENRRQNCSYHFKNTAYQEIELAPWVIAATKIAINHRQIINQPREHPLLWLRGGCGHPGGVDKGKPNKNKNLKQSVSDASLKANSAMSSLECQASQQPGYQGDEVSK